jgi:hypothetical protein
MGVSMVNQTFSDELQKIARTVDKPFLEILGVR